PAVPVAGRLDRPPSVDVGRGAPDARPGELRQPPPPGGEPRLGIGVELAVPLGVLDVARMVDDVGEKDGAPWPVDGDLDAGMPAPVPGRLDHPDAGRDLVPVGRLLKP